ncbi:hypothetical protein A2U01_0080760, partial [Trifolium medium]|nr:hypothetical protein [Trifolium medium]
SGCGLVFFAVGVLVVGDGSDENQHGPTPYGVADEVVLFRPFSFFDGFDGGFAGD